MKCKFCDNDHYPQNLDEATDSNEYRKIILCFSSGRSYIVPDNLPHLIISHEFQPMTCFIGDVMNSRFVPRHLSSNQGEPIPIIVGQDYPMGAVPATVPYRLKDFIHNAYIKVKENQQ